MGSALDETKLESDLHVNAKRVSEKDVGALLERVDELDEKLVSLPGRFQKLFNQVKLLFGMIGDYWNGVYKDVPWYTIAMAVAAVVYFLSPVDLIPDPIPVIGYVDDATVLLLTFKAIREDLKAYCAFKGYASVQYF